MHTHIYIHIYTNIRKVNLNKRNKIFYAKFNKLNQGKTKYYASAIANNGIHDRKIV